MPVKKSVLFVQFNHLKGLVACEKGCFVVQSNHLKGLKSWFKEAEKFQIGVLMRITLWPIKTELLFLNQDFKIRGFFS